MCDAAESAVEHINKIRSDLLGQIKERRQECLDSLKTRLSAQLQTSEQEASKLQQEIAKVSRETTQFVLKWKDFFRRADSLASEQEMATALGKVQSVLQEIQKCEEESRQEAINKRLVQFEANNLFFETRDHLGKLTEFLLESIKDEEEDQDEYEQAEFAEEYTEPIRGEPI